MLEKESSVIEQAKIILIEEGEQLRQWMKYNIKFLRSEKELMSIRLIPEHTMVVKDSYSTFVKSLSYKQARKILTIYKKAKNLGFPQRKPELYEDILKSRVEYIEKQIDEYIKKHQTKPQISREEARAEYSNYLKNSCGISFEDLCPKCKSPLIVRKNTIGRYRFAHYIGCSNYPKCDFLASPNNKYLTETERAHEQEIINKALSIPMSIWGDLCYWLEAQRGEESQKKFHNWHIALKSIRDITAKINDGKTITRKAAERLMEILEKAIAVGFKCDDK